MSEGYVQMMTSLSGGNPDVLYRDATQYVWAERTKDKAGRQVLFNVEE